MLVHLSVCLLVHLTVHHTFASAQIAWCSCPLTHNLGSRIHSLVEPRDVPQPEYINANVLEVWNWRLL